VKKKKEKGKKAEAEATELRGQVRSQVQLGNEGTCEKNRSHDEKR
jgi:hypothetical protein